MMVTMASASQDVATMLRTRVGSRCDGAGAGSDDSSDGSDGGDGSDEVMSSSDPK
jgi:hypothetical protein